MEKLDNTTVSLLQAANITDELLPSLTREDLRDLLPGPENFLRRKSIWEAVHPEEILTSEVAVKPVGDQTSLPQTSTPKRVTPKKVMKISSPDYVIYTDTELDQVRKYHSELERCGRAHECTMSKELRCRLVRNTMTSMISILRANEMQDRGDSNYPSREEVSAMAKRLTEYYPMLQDKDNTRQPWDAIFRQMIKRLQNVKSSQNLMSPPSTPKPSQTPRSKKRQLEFTPNHDAEYDADSSASTDNADPPENTTTDLDSDDSTVPGHDSREMQARHHQTLQELWKKPRPNQHDVAHLLDLEFESRRDFIHACSPKEEERTQTVIEAYPCFKDPKHVMEEMGRLLEADNKNFTDQIKARWESFCQNALFFGVWNKSLKPPMGLDKSEQAIALWKALPSMFPSPTAPPKKLGSASEALFHVLEPSEDPSVFLQRRPITSPVLLVESTNILLAVGTMPLMTLPKDMIHEAPLILMGCYYTFHLTYPKCVSTLLSIIQTEILKDSIHERDLTQSYKKSLAEWRDFTKK